MLIYPSVVKLAWFTWLTVLAGVLYDYRQLLKERREYARIREEWHRKES